MVDQKYLLDDETMRDFIINGYIVVKPSLPPDFHKSVFKQTLAVIENDGRLGNALFSEVPMLQQVFDDPTVDGALTSILGQNYTVNRHNACHYHPPGSQGQEFHKDYPLGGNVRYHRPRLAMAFYYPQDVTEDMGPTAIQPTTQYCMTPQNDAPGLALCGEAGTVTIVHYELWHRATENRSDKIRFMLKFLFCRMEEPTRASWNAEQPIWESEQVWAYAPTNGGIQHQAMWPHIWNWYHGGQNGEMKTHPQSTSQSPSQDNGHDTASTVELIKGLGSEDVSVRRTAADALRFAGADAADEVMPALREKLNDPDEVVRLNAAYALGTIGEPTIPTLMDALRRESETAWEPNLNRNDYTNPSQLDTPFGLAAIGTPALPALTAALDDPKWWVRAAAAMALGCMGPPASPATSTLTEALKDESEWVRRNAADSLGNIGHLSSEAMATRVANALVEALDDKREVARWSLSDSPFRENAITALVKMGHPLPSAIPALEKALTDENEYIRSWATIALGASS